LETLELGVLLRVDRRPLVRSDVPVLGMLVVGHVTMMPGRFGGGDTRPVSLPTVLPKTAGLFPVKMKIPW